MSETCPKCAAPRSGDSCPKCGLVFEKFNPDRLVASVPASVVALWDNVEKNWEDAAAHALFVEQALLHHAAGYVATCYRQKGDDPVALAQLEKLTGRLLLALNAEGAGPRLGSKPLKRVVNVLLLFIIAILVFLIFAQSMR